MFRFFQVPPYCTLYFGTLSSDHGLSQSHDVERISKACIPQEVQLMLDPGYLTGRVQTLSSNLGQIRNGRYFGAF